MKSLTSKIFIFLLVIPMLNFGNDLKKWKHSETKTINKEFKVNADALLKVKNKYGNIDITTWNENKIAIKVKITVEGNNEKRVLEELEKINVEFEGDRNMVSARTIFERRSSSWSFWGKSRNVSYQINYTIKMPVTNSVNLNNDYGNVLMNHLEGKASVNCDYGKIILGELHHSNNEINIDYTSASTIGFMNGGSINADYSKLTVEKANNIQLNSDYSHMVFDKVSKLRFNGDYGSITVGKGEDILGKGDYITTKFDAITKALDLNLEYGAIRINEVSKGFKSIDIKSEYTSIKIGTALNNDFTFSADINYSNLKYNKDDNNFTLTKQIKEPTHKFYQGYYNNQNSNSVITIKSSYGNVTFKTN